MINIGVAHEFLLLAMAEFKVIWLPDGTVTGRADSIVRKETLPFRIAHKLVGKCVKDAIEAGSEVTHEILQNASRDVFGKEISLTADETNRTIGRKL